MNKTTQIIGGIVIIIIIVVLVAVFYKPAPKEAIKIGFIGPLTGDGASYGQSEKNAVEMAVEEINSKKGIKGRPIQVIYEDGKCNGQDAVTAAQKLININKVKVILGGACSGETMAVAPITEENKVVLFSAFSSNPAISFIGDFVFRNTPSDKDVAEGMASTPIRDGHKRIAILTENTDFALGVRENLVEKLEGLEAEVVMDEFYNQGTKDFRTQLIKIKNVSPDALIFNPQSGIPGGLAVRQAKELGINCAYYGGFVFSSGDALKSGGTALNGMLFVDAPGLSKSNPKAQEFISKFLEKYPKPASDWEIGARYDSVYLITEAMKICGDIDTECIRDYLYDLEEYNGVIGNYHFDENGDPAGLKTYAVKKIIDAENEIIEELE